MSISDGIVWDEQKIRQYFDECTSRYENYYDNLTTLENCLRTFANDDDHKGEEADNARMFINDVQIPMLNDMARVIRLLQMKQQKLLSEFDGIIDSAENTIVYEEKLKDVIKDFAGYLSSFDELADNISKVAKALNESCSLGGMFDFTVPKKTSAIRAFEKMTDENGQNGLVPEHKKAVIGFDDEHKNDVGPVSEFGKLISMIRQNIRRIHSAAEGEDVSNVILDYKHQTELKKQLLRPENILSEEELKRYEAYIEQLEKYLRGEATRCSVFGSDPVNMTEGNYVGHKTDMDIDGNPRISFTRFYNAKSDYTGVFGKGWSHTYDQRITEDRKDGDTVIRVRRCDGSEHIYYENDKGTISREIHGELGRLKRTLTGWELSFENGRKEKFDKEGWFKEYAEVSGGRVVIKRDAENPERILEVTALNGSKFLFLYDNDGFLTEIKDHTGRSVNYIFSKASNNDEASEGENKHQDKILIEVHELTGSTRFIRYDADGRISELGREGQSAGIKNVYAQDGRIIEQHYADGNHVTFQYDDDKKETIYTEQNGNVIRIIHDEKHRHIATVFKNGTEYFGYDDRNNQISYTDRNGNTTRYTYDNKGHRTGIINALGDRVSMTYDAGGHLYAFKKMDGSEWRFIYDSRGNLQKIKDPLQNVTSFTYDPLGQCTEIIRPDHSRVSAKYVRGNLTEITEPSGGVRRFEYDDLNRLTAETDAEGNRSEYSYDALGHMISSTDPMGNTLRWEYRPSGKVKAVIHPDGTKKCFEYNEIEEPSSFTDEKGKVTFFKYNSMQAMSDRTLPNGGKYHYEYDAFMRLSSETDPAGVKTYYEYDAVGNILSISVADEKIHSFEYDEVGRIIRQTDGEGQFVERKYDSLGQVTSTKDTLGNETRYEYDAAGRMTARTDALGSRYEWKYDNMNRLTTVTDPNGIRKEYRYDIAGNLTDILYGGKVMETRKYDLLGRVKEREHADGFTVTYKYDASSRISDIYSSNGNHIHYTYDCMGRVREKSDEGDITSYEYDHSGKLTAVIDALGHRTRYEYNDLGQIEKVSRDRERIESRKDTDSIEASEILPDGHVTIYEHDIAGRLTAVVDALGQKETYEYDIFGRISSKTDRDGNKTEYTYDRNGRVKGICYADGRTVKFTADGLGHISAIEDWIGITEIENDIFGNALSVKSPDGSRVSYEYGLAGERKAIIYPNGERVEYRYDDRARLSELIEGEKTSRYRYDEFDRLIRRELPNGIIEKRSYYQGGQLRTMESGDAGGILDRYTYHYGVHGERTEVDRERRDMPDLSGKFSYSYDPAGRLTQIKRNEEILREYGYDSFGNRISMVEGERRTEYNYNNLDQLISSVTRSSVTDDVQEKGYRYDKRGNLIESLINGQNHQSYNFDAAGKLTGVVDAVKGHAEYSYNGLGFRTESKIHAYSMKPDELRRIEYICDITRNSDNLLMQKEGDKTDTFIRDYRAVVSMKNAEDEYWYLQDELGSTQYLTGTDGRIVNTGGYDDFGRKHAYSVDGNIIQPFAFTGYQTDEINDLQYANARYYDPEIGRFVSKDDEICQDFALPDTLNPYLYCLSDPISFVDPSGNNRKKANKEEEGTPDPYDLRLQEGDEAHRFLQAYFMRQYGNRRWNMPGELTKGDDLIGAVEHRIKYKETGMYGFADLVLFNGKTAEVYEIKPARYLNPECTQSDGTPMKDVGEEQLKKYITYLRWDIAQKTPDDFKIPSKISLVVAGKTFNPSGIAIESVLHPGQKIVFSSVGNGMIYYYYVKNPGNRVVIKLTDEEKNKSKKARCIKMPKPVDVGEVAEEDEDVAAAAMTGLKIGAGIGIAYCVYELFKWGIAALLAPETAGGSLVVAGCTP